MHAPALLIDKSARLLDLIQQRWISFLVLAVAIAAWYFGLADPELAALPLMGMAISFNQVPSNLLIPFVAVEFDNTKAMQGPTQISYRALLIGQKRSTGSAAANSLHRVTSVEQVITLAGRGSMLHRMAIKWFAINRFTETYIGVLEDNGAGVAAAGELAFTGPSTAAGTIHLYAGATYIPVAIASGTSADDIAAAVAAALPSTSDLPVTGAATDADVAVTHRHKGPVGNYFDLRVNQNFGEALPAGVGVTITPMASGATNPTLTSLIAAMGDQPFHVIVHPYANDATAMTAIETELASRFGPMRPFDGVAITSAVGTQSALGTLGDGRNSKHQTIVSQPGKNPLVPPSEFAAGVAATVAYYANIDPARPLQTLVVDGMVPPSEADRFTDTERNLLLGDGIGTTKVGGGGVVQIERLVTTYQTNASGVPDASYRDLTTMLTLLYLRYDWRARVGRKFPRHKLADDGTNVGPGQAVVTPKVMKAEALAWFREKEEMGLVENYDQFKRDLVVERDVADRNRINVLLPPDLINQLVVSATSMQFRL